ncbi:MAG: SRPBCC family protein [Ignavibacteriae bacterium]|nr:SRPBCC family protein [Ignavibacteriota bacterium]
MAVFEIVTEIRAPIEHCFDLSRNIDFHVVSTARTGERAVAGRTTGMVELGDTITFSARHLGFRWELTSEIIQFDRPRKFTDQMLRGPFKDLRHEHIFESRGDITVMTDRMKMVSPFGFIGKAFDSIYLVKYMKRFLARRCNAVKECLESDEWKKYL